MPKKDSSEPASLPGVPENLFSAAVKVVANLRDSGELQVFLPRRNAITFIGDLSNFRELLAKEAGQDVSEEDTQRCVEEVRRASNLLARAKSMDVALRFIEGAIYDDEVRKLTAAQKTEFRERERAKMELVSSHLLTPMMRQRVLRLKTSTAPCLEDADFEVVEQRTDTLQNTSVLVPFLRVRLRYSDEDMPSRIFPWGFGVPWDISPSPVDTFEIECDESDIDVLISRLSEAKASLIHSRDRRESDQSGPE